MSDLAAGGAYASSDVSIRAADVEYRGNAFPKGFDVCEITRPASPSVARDEKRGQRDTGRVSASEYGQSSLRRHRPATPCHSIFCQFLETARAELIYSFSPPLVKPDCEFVIASLVLDFESEMHWPGTVQVGTKISAIGNTSFKLEQAIFQDENRVATARSVIVCVDQVTRRPRTLPSALVTLLSSYERNRD